jgi:hypothetical protein
MLKLYNYYINIKNAIEDSTPVQFKYLNFYCYFNLVLFNGLTHFLVYAWWSLPCFWDPICIVMLFNFFVKSECYRF